MLPLTKLLHPSDLEDEAMAFPLKMLEQTQDLLHEHKLLDELPVSWRKWEYAQGLRALLKAKPNPTILEVGGSTSLFMPTVVHHGLAGHYVCLDTCYNPGAPGGQELAIRASQQGLVACAASLNNPGVNIVPHKDLLPQGTLYDFIACISVVENLEPGRQARPLDEYGHRFMFRFLEGFVPLLAPGGILFLTSDCIEKQPDNVMFSWLRNGAWDSESWEQLRTGLEDEGLTGFGPEDFTWTGPHVYGAYTFASMALQKAQ